jgi:hypothetical protein
MQPNTALGLLLLTLLIYVGFDLLPLLGYAAKLSEITILQLGAVSGSAVLFLFPKAKNDIPRK